MPYPVSRHIHVLQMVSSAKIAGVYNPHSECKRCAIILFTVCGVVAMEMECLWLLIEVCKGASPNYFFQNNVILTFST